MTILVIALIWSAFLIGYLVGAWRANSQQAEPEPWPPLWVTLAPQVTEAIVRQAVSDALAEWEDAEEDDRIPGDEWKYPPNPKGEEWQYPTPWKK
jgi:hypothetical protein